MNRKKTGQSSFTVGDSLNWANENVAGSNRQYAIGDKVIAGINCGDGCKVCLRDLQHKKIVKQ